MPGRQLTVFLAIGVAASVLVATALADPPSLDPPAQGNIGAEATGPDGAAVSWAPVTATDPEDGTIVLACTPGPGVFPLGTAAVSCDGSDTEDNPIAHGFSVIVADTTGPAVEVTPASQTLPATGPGGAEASYSATATDAVDGTLTPSCGPIASGATFPIGTTTITCTATDATGNPGSGTATVTVTAPPNSPPVLALPGAITSEAAGPLTAITYSVTATDAEDDPDPEPSCTPASGSGFAFGGTTVSCTVTDGDGATDSGSFSVTIVDTTPPAVTAPANATVPATGPSGAAVAYGPASAADLVDGSLPASCSPVPGSVFPLGTTTVTCAATDSSGNSGSAVFAVTVQDASAPVVSVPGNVTVEATGPTGAAVTYGAVTATDDVDGPIATVPCSIASGPVFPLGRTSVRCSATDSSGKTGTATFFVTVEDRTPPVLTPPADIGVKSTEPLPATDPAIQSFLAGAAAADLVDTDPELTNDAPATFELGFTTVTFTATDEHGNRATATARVEVGPRPLQAEAIDRVPPENVKKLAALAGNRSFLFRWSNPTVKDFAYVEVTRTPGQSGAEETRVYRGAKTSFRDSGLAEGEQYRYLFVSYDETGNRSVGVAIVVLGTTQLLLSPLTGATVTRPPLLTWKKTPGATLHNLQLFFTGPSGATAREVAAASSRKVLSVFPKGTSYRLRASWTFEGKRQALKRGCYVWYVWPYLASGQYGELLGQSEFCYRPKSGKS
ncbi:MAG: HYR domain-containing protein [Thermoleophilia bacterium]|nr:HYR domain-containing protein [Thermoleophilia bacterium]